MTLPDNLIQEFREIWKDEFGEKLSDEEARFEAARVLEFCWLLVQPVPRTPDDVTHST